MCKIPDSNKKLWGKLTGDIQLLAVITPYRTGGKDAALDIVFHSQALTPIVTDIQSITSVVGRIQTRGKRYIIDRTGGMIRPEFIPAEDPEEDEEEEE